MIETDVWPFIEAKHYTKVDPAAPRTVRVVVIHDAEFPEKPRAARGIAAYFATTDTEASAHLCIDDQEIVQCVHDRDVAWAAPGCNRDGLQIELAGYANQTPSEWRDAYSTAVINNAAKATAQYCLKFCIPPIWLTDQQLAHGMAGIVGHDQVSRVYKKSDHSDPGKNFDWRFFMSSVVAQYALRKAKLG